MGKIGNKTKKCMRYMLERMADLERQIAYRTYEKYHIVKTGLAPGYRDIDERMFHACFQLLVDFVEIECASLNWELDEDDIPDEATKTKLLKALSKVWLFRMFLPPMRSPARGIDYLNWQANLEIAQHISAEEKQEAKECWGEIKKLYVWWKQIRPFRTCPYEASGYAAFIRQIEQKYSSEYYYFQPVSLYAVEMKYHLSDREMEEKKIFRNKMYNIQKEYYKEDEDNLVKLIKMREYLWS